MITMLIVDDEPVVRSGIRYSIPWSKYDVTVVGEAENGKVAMKKAIQLKPDLVICDIRMPVEDGISFIHNIRKIMPDLQMVMLTGYSDYEYMVEAIKANVCNYLLKPASMEQIVDAVLQIKSKIELSRMDMLQSQKKDELLSENIDILREHFAEDLLAGKMSEKRLLTSITTLNIPLHGPYYVILLAMSKQKESWNLIQEALSIFKDYSPAIINKPQERIVSFILNLNEPLSQEEMDKKFQRSFSSSNNIVGGLAISKAINGINEFPETYNKLMHLINRGIWYPNGTFLFEDTIKFPEISENEIVDLERKLFDAIREAYPHKITECAENLFDRLVELKIEYPDFIEKIHTIENTINVIWGLEEKQEQDDEMNISKIREHFIQCSKEIRPNQSKYGNGLIGRVLRYMEQNYSQELTLESVASQLFISPTYLSRLLKSKTKLGFHGWLDYFRIQKSKDLLINTSLKHYQIAEAVGYSSYKIFSEHFQEAVGCTAKDYRAQFVNNSNQNKASENY